MKRLIGVSITLAAAITAILLIGGGGATSGGKPTEILANAASGQIRPARIHFTVTQNGKTTSYTKPANWFSAGTLAAAKVPNFDERAAAADAQAGADFGNVDLGQNPGTLGCSRRERGQKEHGNEFGNGKGKGNVRVNQDCTFRRQAETDIIYNPADPKNLIAGQNDSRVGFNQCGFDWSTDNGQHWGDGIPPYRQKINSPEDQAAPVPGDNNRHTILGNPGTFHTYDANSDPAMAFDSEGRGFQSCVSFDVFTNATLLYVTQSPKGAEGSFYFNLSSFGRRFIVDEDNTDPVAPTAPIPATVFNDKQFITSDTFRKLPNGQPNPRVNNVYVTWSLFSFDERCRTDDNPSGQCGSPIYGSMSTDHAQTWSTPELVSKPSPTCAAGTSADPAASANACDNNQGSDPVVLPNGDLAVIYNNGNTNSFNAQQLATHCVPSGDSPAGTAHLNCGPSVKAGTDASQGEPTCEFGRGPEECIPGAYIRTNDFPRMNVNPANGHLYATWQDYQRRDNGQKEFSIQLTESTDGGLTWSTVKTVNPDTNLDHYFPAIDLAKAGKGESDDNGDDDEGNASGDHVGVSYYRTERVPNEDTSPADGFTPGRDPGVEDRNSDYVLAGGTGLSTPYPFRVLSPVFPPPDGAQEGFNGDYSGLTINKGSNAHPIWSDTRNKDPYAPANGVVRDEDVFTDSVNLPNGQASLTQGQVGKGGQKGNGNR